MSLFYRLKSCIPFRWLQPYHYLLAQLAAFWYGHPSRKLVVIGVTGTNGKTTTAYFITKALEVSGQRTGCTTTALLKVGDREWMNRTKMTMPGRFFVQRMLRDMVEAGCRYVVIETSSQGLMQFRHRGIDYDIAVFTNLTPEHLEAHGGFENYKKMKARLFEAVDEAPSKMIDGHKIPKAVVLNRESPYANFYADCAPHVPSVWYGLTPRDHDVVGPISLRIPGTHNVENALAALAVCRVLNIDRFLAETCLSALPGVPGRLERVDIGQPWTVVIDYAYEPEALRRCVEALGALPHARLIHVLGGCGGGRDVSRRPLLGAFAATHADLVIVTNEDPYDDDPQMIIDQTVAGALQAGKRLHENLFAILDRQEAINFAMTSAKPGDLVLLTGKGCEPWICVAHGKKMPWDERAAAEAAIRQTSHFVLHALS